jgi:TonB family protein
MLSSNLRIITALIFSMAVHGMLISTEFGPERLPVTGVSRKKVSVRLVSRRAKVNRVVERVVADRTEKIVRRLPVLPEVVEVAVKEIPAFSAPARVTVPDLVEDASDLRSEAAEESVEDNAESLSSAVVLARPLYLDNQPPEYPALARRRHWQGTVVLAVIVSSQGKVLRSQVSESSGREVLDEAALQAVSAWRFEPGRRGLLKVDMQVLVPVRFSLQ